METSKKRKPDGEETTVQAKVAKPVGRKGKRVETAAASDPAERPKRKHGRPKKEAAETGNGVGAQVASKRKPVGRPKRTATASGSGDGDGEEEAPKKKSVGKRKKTVTATGSGDGEDEAPKKMSGGRPKKMSEAEATGSGDGGREEAAPKKKPGGKRKKTVTATGSIDNEEAAPNKKSGRRSKKMSESTGGDDGDSEEEAPKNQPTAEDSNSEEEELWCWTCFPPCRPRDDCGALNHELLGLEASRDRANATMEGARRVLRALDELERVHAPKLLCVADVPGAEGDGPGKAEVAITLCLSSDALDDGDRETLIDAFSDMEMTPEDRHLSGHISKYSQGGAAIQKGLAALYAKLVDRVAGVDLKPGALLLFLQNPNLSLYSDDSGEDCEDEENAEEEEEEEEEGKEADPHLRIYYAKAVKANQAKGSRVLGYVTSNLEHLGAARPRGAYYKSGDGDRYDTGSAVEFSNARFDE